MNNKVTVNISDPRIDKDLSKILKEQYNLKLQALFYVLINHPEIIETIDQCIDKHDRSWRYLKNM